MTNELEQAMRHPDVIKNQIKQNGGRETVVPYSPSNPPPYPVTSVNGQTGDVTTPSGLTFDDIYPVGSIYMSVNSTNPGTLFGGTWTQIEDTFLLAAGTTYTAGDTGGEAAHTLTKNELPAEKLGIYVSSTWLGYKNTTASAGSGIAGLGSQTGTELKTANMGSGNAHNNMPPYLVVYVWKRTA